MKLKTEGPNACAILFRNGVEVFFSYKTAVAGFYPGMGYVRTERHYSATTTRHIKNYLGTGVYANCKVIAQDMIDNLVGDA